MKLKKIELKNKKLLVNCLLLLLLLLPVNSFAWPFGRDKDLDEIARLDLPKVVIPGFRAGLVATTPVGIEIFEEFMKIKNFDMSYVRQLLNRHSGSKFYHLYSAYCYGFYRWQNTSNPYEQERIKRAVWNIAVEFEIQNHPRWQKYLVGMIPTFVWTGVAIFAVSFGSYLRKHNKAIFEKYSDKIFDFFLNLVKRAVSKDDGKTPGNK